MSTKEDGAGPKSKTRTLIIALAAILLLILVGAVVWGAVSSEDEVAVAEPTPAVEPRTAGSWTVGPLGRKVWVAEGETGDLLPQKDPVEQRIEWPTATDEITLPEGFQLQEIGNGVQVAVSTSDGPTGFTNDGVQTTGYALTGQGAALMAADTITRPAGGLHWELFTIDGRSLEAITEDQRAAALAIPEDETYSATTEGTLVRFAPEYFRTQFCDIDVCVVEFLGGSLGELTEGQISTDAPQYSQQLKHRFELHNVNGSWKIADLSTATIDTAPDEGWVKWQ